MPLYLQWCADESLEFKYTDIVILNERGEMKNGQTGEILKRRVCFAAKMVKNGEVIQKIMFFFST